jgi:hypothetical protein
MAKPTMKFECVVIKPPHRMPQMFKAWAAQFMDVESPGAPSANVKNLWHTRCPRPRLVEHLIESNRIILRGGSNSNRKSKIANSRYAKPSYRKAPQNS